MVVARSRMARCASMVTAAAVLAVIPTQCYGQTAELVISGAALLKDILDDISSKLMGDVSARTDAQAESIGPDGDDLGVRAAADEFDGPFGLEWELEAWTTGETGGLELGPNAGSPHKGYARMNVEWSDGAWVIQKGSDGTENRYAFANAAKDTTPVAGSNNPTAAAAAATFSINGAIREGWTIKDATSGGTGHASGAGTGDIRLEPSDGIDVKGISTAAYVWPMNAFNLDDMVVGSEVMTTITPPQSELLIGHSFLQLDSSPNFRRRYADTSGRSPLLDGIVAAIDGLADGAHGTIPFGAGDTADFTVAGGQIALSPTTMPRAGMTDRELIEMYLSTLAVLPPDNAQTGYAPTVTLFALLGGGKDFPAGSELGEEGGFGFPESSLEPANFPPFDLSAMVGFVVETRGTLTAAANLALQTAGHPIQPLLADAMVNDTVSMDMTFSDSDEVQAASENEITIEEPAVYWNGGTGFWFDRNWSPGGVPPAPFENAVINTTDSHVTLPMTAFANSTAVISGRLQLAPAAILNSRTSVEALGALSGSGRVNNTLTNRGSVEPGEPFGTLTVLGNFAQEVSGTIRIELGGVVPGNEHDLLNVFGHLDADGTLEVVLQHGFIPPIGHVFDILNFNSASGQFLDIILPQGFLWDTSNLLTQGTISALGFFLPGDYNGDGVVDFADLQNWRSSFGQLVPHPGQGADGNGNGIVDAGDYTVWRDNFGAFQMISAAGGLQGNGVPEPSVLALLYMLLAAIAFGRRPSAARTRA